MTDDAFTSANAFVPVDRPSDAALPCVMTATISRPSCVRSVISSLTAPVLTALI